MSAMPPREKALILREWPLARSSISLTIPAVLAIGFVAGKISLLTLALMPIFEA